jgi:hypothetical protein
MGESFGQCTNNPSPPKLVIYHDLQDKLVASLRNNLQPPAFPSALDEIPNDHSRYPPLISPDCK